MKTYKLTLVLFVLVFGTLGLTIATRSQSPANRVKDDNSLKQLEDKKRKFPTADYDEPDLTDPKKNQAQKEKKIRQNSFSIVARNPPEWQAERMFMDEGLALTPALPSLKSSYIVLGEVRSAGAHVSENKENVYSEFTVMVSKVFKAATNSISEGVEVTVDRVGGFVKYPNGRTVLYRVAGKNMPAVGSRYIFFLTSPNDQDLTILTAYALEPGIVTPLDDLPQFEKFRGVSHAVFLQELHSSLAESP